VNPYWVQFGYDLAERFQLGVAGPNLSFVNAADALQRGPEGFAEAENTSGASAGGADYEIALVAIHQDHGAGLRFRSTQLLQNLDPLRVTVLQVGADYRNILLIVVLS